MAEGEQRDAFETLEILSTLYDSWAILGQNCSVGLCDGTFSCNCHTELCSFSFLFL